MKEKTKQKIRKALLISSVSISCRPRMRNRHSPYWAMAMCPTCHARWLGNPAGMANQSLSVTSARSDRVYVRANRICWRARLSDMHSIVPVLAD